MKKFWESLGESLMNIFDFEKNKMIPLTSKEYKSYLNQTNYHICKKEFGGKYITDKYYRKVMDYCHFTGKYRGAVHSIWNLKYSIPKEIPVVFDNGLN